MTALACLQDVIRALGWRLDPEHRFDRRIDAGARSVRLQRQQSRGEWQPRSLSQELGPRKIRVNSLNPGMVETDGLRASGLHEGEFRDQQEKATPLGRIATPEDIALAATFLASDARWITGQLIVVAGGKRM